MQKRQPLYLVNGALASVVLYYVLRLSASGRTPIDFVVIGLVIAAILWNVVQLGLRLQQFGGGKALWHMLRTLLFWFLGLGYAVFVRPEDVGTWRNWMGWPLLVIAVFDSFALLRKERRSIAMTEQPESA